MSRSKRASRPYAPLWLLALPAIALTACSSKDRSLAMGSWSANAAYVPLTRGAHPLARPENDLGRLDAGMMLHHLSLVFALSPAQKAERDALLADLERPGSPNYHQWLTPEEYAARFGARPDDIGRASDWLASQGFTVDPPSRLGARVTFSGTVAQVESAFRTEMHRYAAFGETHYAMASAPSVPAELADHVLAVYNAHDFYPRHARPKMRVLGPNDTCPSGDTFCSGNGIGPLDWSFIYDVGSLYNPGIGGTKITGSGVTIAIVGITDIAQADLTAFRSRYGLAANNITKTLVPNTGTAQADNGAGIEAVLDTEWSGAVAPSATINYVYTGADDANVSDAVYYAIEQNFGGVLSESWGGCEAGATPSDADVLEVYGSAASLLGITYVASSGDDGAADCGGTGGLYVNLPASYPGVTSVGGTGFAMPGGLTFTSGTVTAVGTEAVWNESTTTSIAAGGGGISSVFARPAYQSGISTCTPVGSLPTTVTPSQQREVPDISFTAASGRSQYGIFIECTVDTVVGDCTNTGTNPKIVEIGGTSASAPSFAGVVALAAQATGGRLGNINPLLYALDASVPAAFHDITTGDNEVTCKPTDPGCPAGKKYGFAATSGYDCATGLGSLDASAMVNALVALAPTTTTVTATPTMTTEGGSVQLAATVDVQGTNANVLGGTVTFTFRSYLANGDVDLSWTLGEVAVSGSKTSGTATLSTAIPPGMIQPGQSVDVFATYGGDANHLPSFSSKQTITFAPVYLCINPPTASVAAGATINYTASGGVAPVRWYLDYDSTCSSTGTSCSTLDTTTGVFKAGSGAAGYVIVVAIDADGAETFGEVTVAGGSGTVPWTNGPPNYSGIVVSLTPATTCGAGQNCGTIPNGCGGTVSCGTACTAPDSCGGGGVANQCGCTSNPIATTCAGKCGTVMDNCNVAQSCGTTYCPSPPANATTTCTGNTCGFACDSGYHLCSGACVPNTSVNSCGTTSCVACPTIANGTATCNGTSCGIACNSGYHLCAGVCVSNTSVNSCGTTSCVACPTDPNGTATCDGTSCSISCAGGYNLCHGACTSATDPNNCGASCTVCPAPTDSCMAAACIAGTCGGVPINGCVHDMAMTSGADMAMTSGGGDMASGEGDMASGEGGDMTPGDLASGSSGGPADAGGGGGKGNGCGCQVGGAPRDPGASTALAAIVILGLLLRRRRLSSL